MLNFSTDLLDTRGRASEYSKVLGEYYTSVEPYRNVRAEVHENDLLNAFSIGFSVGRLRCSIHHCNSPFHRYSIDNRAERTGYSLEFVKDGALTLVSDDNELQMGPGDLAFIRPMKVVEYRVREGGSTTIGVHIPWRLAQSLCYGRKIALDRVFSRSSGIGACVVSLIEAMTDRYREFSAMDRAGLQTVVAEAIVQLGTSTAEDAVLISSRAEMLQGLKDIAASSLDDPELTPARVAEQAGISVRTLHRSFQASGETFWSWVRDMRLDRCYLELTDPSFARRSITEVSFRWGFNELSTFDRIFRKRYGMSPRMARSSRDWE